ncbi:putative histone-lysine N-methyltransferase PRDM6 [Actinia tenebrosa]|uniref:Histone-lysine N-methyltransferase PRDM6 n=1 Tax=Actinia tenebrosa TaxID=6105 RepID=A0A6P8H7W5_ACTTE|nr:putative histone-lysine N-methyltransferase PRDM6 [Actinia tenebrosa]
MISPEERKPTVSSPSKDRIKVSWEDFYAFLYGHREVVAVDPENVRHKYDKKRRVSQEKLETEKIERRRSSSPLAALVFPDEVQLCRSSIPGAKLGVCAARTVPPGTWIGPYEGHLVTREEIKPDTDTRYMWEIYKDGKFNHYVDGQDEKTSSWMRFIQCARYREEQNMTVFQYCGNIYYRAYKHIPAGRELLVWYDEKYSELIDIPALLKNLPRKETGTVWRNPLGSPNSAIPRENDMFYNGLGQENGLDRLSQHNGIFPMDLNDTGEVNMWKCGQCNQTFSQRVLLQMHICSQAPDKPFHCGHCPTVFKDASELRDHVVTHINEKPFKCGFCGRSFAGATTLNNHIRTHTGEKPFKCRKCNKTFTQSTQLSRHQKNPEECIPSSSEK